MRPVHALLAGCLLVGLTLLLLAMQGTAPSPGDPVVAAGGAGGPEEPTGLGPTLRSTSAQPPASASDQRVAPDPAEPTVELAANHVLVEGRATYPAGRPAAAAAMELTLDLR